MKTINIDDLLGVKYVHNGRDPKIGLDCYGLAIEVSKRFGHELPDMESFFSSDRIFEDCEAQARNKVNVKVIKEPKTEGDVLLIKNPKGIRSHIGIYLGDGEFIHCNNLGVHLEHLKRYENFIGKVYTWL